MSYFSNRPGATLLRSASRAWILFSSWSMYPFGGARRFEVSMKVHGIFLSLHSVQGSSVVAMRVGGAAEGGFAELVVPSFDEVEDGFAGCGWF